MTEQERQTTLLGFILSVLVIWFFGFCYLAGRALVLMEVAGHD